MIIFQNLHRLLLASCLGITLNVCEALHAQQAPVAAPKKVTSESPAKTTQAEKEPVVSFQSDSDKAVDNTKTKNGTVNKLSFNFRYAPWADVLKLFAEAADLTLDLNQVPPGTFNYYDRKAYTPLEALDILNGYLLPKGYILVRRDEFLVSINIDNGIPPNLIPNISIEELPRRGKNELVSVVLKLNAATEAESAAEEVKQLVGPQGNVVPLKASNSLVVTDIGSNVQRIHKLLSGQDGLADPDAVTFRSFPLKYISAVDAETVLRSLLGLTQSVTNVSAGNDDSRSRYYRQMAQQQSSNQKDKSAEKTQMTAEPRTNSLLVAATAAQMDLIEQALKTIDVETESGIYTAVGRGGPFLKVYTVSSSDPREITKTLDSIMPGVVVNEDGRNKKIHIMATPGQHKEVEELIQQLDGTGGDTAVSVIPLSEFDPLALTATLRAMFAADGDQAPSIEPDVFGNRLLVRGTTEQLAQVKTLLAQLGEDGNPNTRHNSNSGPVRTFSLGGRDPEELLPLIEKLWDRSGNNPIRIVTPNTNRKSILTPHRSESETKAVPEIEQAPAPAPEPEPEPEPNAQPEADHQKAARKAHTRILRVSNQTEKNNDDTKTTEKPTADQDTTAREAAQEAPVLITVIEGELMMTSQDQAALDRLESLLQSLAKTIPARTTWTVFYLRASTADNVASMLEQLFPASQVSRSALSTEGDMLGGLTSGLSSLGGQLMDVTGLSGIGTDNTYLRIIPEERTNALFVSGPKHLVDQVEDVLKILDSNNIPESLRDRVPRMVPVEHADVDEVATIVKEVYKDFMQTRPQLPASRGRGSGSNPLAMLMAAGANQGDNEVKLTVGVDKRTNHLVVSASEQLFKEVETLVKSIDKAARDANRTVRIISLENTSTAVVSQAIGSLLPKVSVSTTSARNRTQSRTQRPSNTTQQNNNNSAQPDEDQIRQFFEQRIRDRFQQQQPQATPGVSNRDRNDSSRTNNSGDRGRRSRGGR